MKKLLILSIALLLGRLAGAQCTFESFDIKPGTFSAEDKIKIEIDVTGTDVANEAELYIWTWCNKGADGFKEDNGITNTDWGNSPALAKLTPAGSPNKFYYEMIGTTNFNMTPGQLKHFQFLVKTKSGSKKTCDSKTSAFDPLVFVPSMQRIFPAKVGQNDVVSLYFHQDLATAINDQRMQPTSATVEVFDNTGASAGPALTLQLKPAGTKTWKAYFIPTRSYTPGAGKKFVRFTYKFNGTVQDVNNQPVAVSTSTVEITLTDMK